MATLAVLAGKPAHPVMNEAVAGQPRAPQHHEKRPRRAVFIFMLSGKASGIAAFGGLCVSFNFIFNSTQLAERVYQHPKFLALRDDIAGVRAVVLKAQEVSRRTIKNRRGLVMRRDGTNVRQ